MGPATRTDPIMVADRLPVEVLPVLGHCVIDVAQRCAEVVDQRVLAFEQADDIAQNVFVVRGIRAAVRPIPDIFQQVFDLSQLLQNVCVHLPSSPLSGFAAQDGGEVDGTAGWCCALPDFTDWLAGREVWLRGQKLI